MRHDLWPIDEGEASSSDPPAAKKKASDAFMVAIFDLDVERAKRLLERNEADANQELWMLSEISPRKARFMRKLGMTSAEGHNIGGWSRIPLIQAVMTGYWPMVQLLLDHGANVNAQSINGNTALMFAAQTRSEDIIRLLVEHGADVDNQAVDGHTALMVAASHGADFVGKLLINEGADVNLENDKGQTALMFAAEHPPLESMGCMLLEHNADINVQDSTGMTALMNAVQNPHHSSHLARILLASDAAVNLSEEHGRTALMFAAQSGSSSIVELLLQHKADAKPKDSNDDTALHYAVRSFKPITKRKTDLLLLCRADINARNQQGRTPLMEATVADRPVVVDLLLKRGANPTIMDITRKTPLGFATAAYFQTEPRVSEETMRVLLASHPSHQAACVERHGITVPLLRECVGEELADSEWDSMLDIERERKFERELEERMRRHKT